ncbi:hypothetical protein K32_14270 [Kaistia sp. 32K]|uniref:bestrophin-like domain n=1 Tax=Kaistia sp. 32K TaxID=2795690 RepID=UPI001915890D|nr:DUF4239 domain-containing protein [Kaistia sp. 32K]BCP52810.1 hypothetical protein K32_14270 [Kaistia sp. 32K]
MADYWTSAGIAVLFAAVALTIVFGSYFLARRLLHIGVETDKTFEAAGSIAVRIAALHGLILALVYAQELDDYKDIRSVLTQEATAISDVYHDAGRYGGPIVGPVQQTLARYLDTVVNQEWDQLGRGEGLSAQAWTEWDDVYQKLLDLTPTTDRERYLANRMRDRITAVAGFRQLRETTAIGRFSSLFWAPALIGLALLAVPFSVYRPSRSNLILLGIFAIYSGVILFFIYAFGNPFAAPGKLEPAPFEHLLRGGIGKSLVDANEPGASGAAGSP